VIGVLVAIDTTAHVLPLTGSPEASASSDSSGPIPILDAIDHLTDGYYEMDAEFRYRRVNPAGLRIAGKTADEIIGKHVFEVFPDIARAVIHQTTVRVMETRKAESVETYYPPHRRWYVNSIYPVTGGIAIFSRDITEQKLLEDNLAILAEASKILSSSLDYQRTLRAVAQLAVPRIADWCAVDMRTGPRTVELLAIAHVDPEKIRWAEELRQRDPVDLERPVGLAKVLLTGRPEFYPEITDALLVASAKDERTLDLARSLGFSSAMIVPLVTQNTTIGAISFVAAESGKRYAAADLRMAEELASRAALAIENSRLYGASQQAVAVRDDFISAASHELRTPVTSLKVYTEVLQRQAERRGDEHTSGQLRKMQAQIDRLAVLIGDLLDVSKIEAGKLELRYEFVDLRRLTDEVVEAIQATTAKHRIVVEGTVRRPVVGDGERLGQVLTNLLTNAVKYSPRSDRIVVRLAETAEEATVDVQDFGIGIDPEHLDRVFDRFYRVTSDDEKTFPGLGMGLYICHEIVRRHGGTMEVTSAKGRGSVFHVALPYGDGVAPDRPEGHQ
jgi:PAS domain S-box-containing protein